MSDNPHANGGLLLARPQDAGLPRLCGGGAEPRHGHGRVGARDGQVSARRDEAEHGDRKNFRLFSPDENNSNRWQDVLEVTNRCYMAEIYPEDDHLSPDGRVMEVLSEHQCQGWLEGYLLTGRHGFFSCYEAFIHIIDSMFNQHAKWLKVCREIPWRRPVASLNYFLSSHVWRQDHNGFSHQDPGIHRPRRQQEGRGDPRLPAARRQHASGGDGSLPAQPQLRQCRGRRQAARAAMADHGSGHQALHARASASGSGPATTRAASPTW